jgi:hypothetical protein
MPTVYSELSVAFAQAAFVTLAELPHVDPSLGTFARPGFASVGRIRFIDFLLLDPPSCCPNV